MIEQDLIDLGFKREDILDVESNNGYDYYYYFLKITEGLTLLSHGNDEITNSKEEWYVYNFDWPDVKINDVNHVTQLKEIVLCFQQN
mgnify:CR=1 FL=1|tara:strand:+ start:1682 stop:1942 length:261 start_codon:yes stop_codon:yes gene_type:complete